MKKFKHKQTGHIATETHSEKNYKVSHPQNYTIPKWIIENSNDWEEVKGPIFGTSVMKKEEYEILSFRFIGYETIWSLKKDGLYGANTKARYTLEEMLKGKNSVEDGNIEIHSVKRLSDGEIFTIGDSCCWESGGKFREAFKIGEFEIYKDRFYVYSDGICRECKLEDLIHVKKPTILTTDNVHLSTGDCLWYYRIDEKYIRMTTLTETNLGLLYKNEIHVFSSREAAENHLNKNKPKFSIQNIEDAYTWDKSAPLYQTFINNLKEAIGE